jgi:hypothetical protein
MSGWPGEISKLANKWKAEQDAARQRKALEAKRQADLTAAKRKQLLWGEFDLHKSAYALDKQFGQAWDRDTLVAMASDKALPIEKRAKLLEIIVMRGANNKMSWREMHEWPSNDNVTYLDINGFEVHEKVLYQLAAQRAIVAEPDLFAHISDSKNQLPSGRVPATELMNSMLQNGGTSGDFDSREVFKEWMGSLDTDVRGRMMYHIADAAQTSDIGRPSRITGFEVSAGPLGLGLQWENARETHWNVTGRSIEIMMASGLTDPIDKHNFNDAYNLAAKRLDTTTNDKPE